MQELELPDPFTLPGTDTLRNHFDLSGEALERIERLHTQIRQEQLLPNIDIPVLGFRAIHKHLFETVYPWAGEIRISHSLVKDATSFLHGRFVPDALGRQFHMLNKESDLRDLALDAFAERAAFHIGELNYIHPFREGNGRTMRLFLRALARQAGHQLRIDRIDRDDWMHACRESTERQDCEALTRVISRAIIGPVSRATTPRQSRGSS
ncbi:MAG TPA: Fic family protein [Methylomirabilota bacterium]|jgi:cell filamentation protein, protein adenylyltransferase|nr:Fic family protein [Methylomirabilota bacterium]